MRAVRIPLRRGQGFARRRHRAGNALGRHPPRFGSAPFVPPRRTIFRSGWRAEGARSSKSFPSGQERWRDAPGWPSRSDIHPVRDFPRAWRSGASHAVDVLHVVGQSILLPRASAILRSEDLSAARGAVHARRIGRMHVDRHHRGIRFDAMIEALPALAEILAAIERAVGAARCRRKTGLHDFRIVRRDGHIATIGKRRKSTDLDVAPRFAVIVGAEQAHAHSEECRSR